MARVRKVANSMTFMPYRFYTIDTRAFLDVEIGSYLVAEDLVEWFRGALPKRIEDIRLKDITPVADWLCETPDDFPEWKKNREHVWGLVDTALHVDDLPGINEIFSSELGFDEINYFLDPGFARPTKGKPVAPADLVDYWCGGVDDPRWTSAHLLPAQKIDWFTSALHRTRDILRELTAIPRPDRDREFVQDLISDLDRAIGSLEQQSPRNTCDWLLVLC